MREGGRRGREGGREEREGRSKGGEGGREEREGGREGGRYIGRREGGREGGRREGGGWRKHSILQNTLYKVCCTHVQCTSVAPSNTFLQRKE